MFLYFCVVTFLLSSAPASLAGTSAPFAGHQLLSAMILVLLHFSFSFLFYLIHHVKLPVASPLHEVSESISNNHQVLEENTSSNGR
jgi:hypothetical protein